MFTVAWLCVVLKVIASVGLDSRRHYDRFLLSGRPCGSGSERDKEASIPVGHLLTRMRVRNPSRGLPALLAKRPLIEGRFCFESFSLIRGRRRRSGAWCGNRIPQNVEPRAYPDFCV